MNMCVEDENVCSVKKENDSGYYRLHTIWKKDGFFINITSKNGAWRGEMTPNDITKMSVQLEMKPESYLNLCKEALTHHGGQPGLVYAVEDGCFAWKKVEEEDSGIKVKIGSVILEPTNFVDTIQNLVTAALNCNKNLQEKLLKVNEKKEKILESKTELLNKLNELLKTKETMENDLYSRFVLLINTKKRKIQELENLLKEKLRESNNIKPENLKSPYEIDTDNDSEGEIQKHKTVKLKRKINPYSEINVKNSNFVVEEAPEEKKVKNDGEGPISANSDIRYIGYSCEPSTSKLESPKQIHQMSLKKATTKDELYDYFYGEI